MKTFKFTSGITFVLVLSATLLVFSFLNNTEAQIFNTSLQIIVRNELGNAEKGVRVRLFKNKEDYESLNNATTETLVTDDKGKVTFKNLEPIVYFVNAEKGDANNFGGGEQTAALEQNKINKLTIVITE